MPSAARRQLLVEPAFFSAPDYALTLGPEVCDLCTDAGFEPDPEQALALDVIFAEDHRGLPSVFEFANLCARQNMKTGLFKQAVLGWLFVTEEHRIAWSAHEFDTAREAFTDLAALIQNSPILSKRLAPGTANGVFTARGSEAIELESGARIKFKARTKTGGRGLTGDKTVLDEAFALDRQHVGAIMPIMSTRPTAQILYGSSACHESSDVLRKIVQRGRAGTSPRLGYMEYCAVGDGEDGAIRCEDPQCSHEPESDGCAYDRRDLIAMANPQAGRRISWEYLADERAAMDPAEFARERLGIHEEPANVGGTLVSAESWGKLVDPDSVPADPVSFGLHLSRDRTKVAIGVAGLRADDLRYHVEIVPAARGTNLETLPGTSWVRERIRELREQWNPAEVVINGRSATESLLPELEQDGPIRVASAAELAQVCGTFYDAIAEGNLRHRGQIALGRSMTSAKARALADAWAWDPKDPTSDITQTMAVTLALLGVRQPTESTSRESAYNDDDVDFIML